MQTPLSLYRSLDVPELRQTIARRSAALPHAVETPTIHPRDVRRQANVGQGEAFACQPELLR